MPRSKVTPLPQPPMVWGPSEVNEWIRGTHPSKRRSHHPKTRRAAKVSALRIKVQAESREDVERTLADVLRDLDFVLEEDGPSRIAAVRKGLTVTAKVHRSVRPNVAPVAVHFRPPVLPSLPRRIVHGLTRKFPLIRMTLVETRT